MCEIAKRTKIMPLYLWISRIKPSRPILIIRPVNNSDNPVAACTATDKNNTKLVIFNKANLFI